MSKDGENEHIAQQIKSYCNLNINRDLPYLKRAEGGLGGDDNLLNKQIRFRYYFGSTDLRKRDNDIVLHEITNSRNEKWNYDQLDDLIYAFTKTANFNVQAPCINGSIELFNQKIVDDYYNDPYVNNKTFT